nr:NF-X1-type zinc finger protein NFXL2 [Tanacetum cinerariifolium]
GLGLLECNSDCKSKIKVDDSELHLRKPKAPEKKEPDVENYVRKRKRRKDKLQEDHQISSFQKIMGILRMILLFVMIVVSLIAMAFFGYKGLMWLNDWMNQVETQRQRKRYPRI